MSAPNQAELQKKYNQFQQTINDISTKIQELTTDIDEHHIVLNTLKSAPSDRRCFRMTGGILLETTVEETKPVLDVKVKNIKLTIDTLNKELKKTTEAFEKWKKEKKIKIIRQ